MTTAKPLNIGLLWHSFFSDNLGVGALTLANVRLIGEAAERYGFAPVFHVLGPRGGTNFSAECPYPNHFLNVGYKAMANPLSPLNRQIRACDIIFDIGGGDSFSDIYPWSRLNLILATKFAAGLAGTPLVLSPQTIGPFYTRRARIAARAAMGLARHIFARDETSRALLDEMGVGAKASLTTDVAFALPFTMPADKDTRDLAAGPIKVGINVSALLYRRDLSKGDKIALVDDYPALIAAVLEKLAAIPRAEVHLVPHVIPSQAPYEDDYAVAETLKSQFPALVLPERFTGPSQAKSYIAGLDLFMGSRMHATIAAISSGTAVVPLGYSRKFSGLFGSLGYDWNVDLTAVPNEAVLDKVTAALDHLPRVRAEAVAANAEAQLRLGNYRDFLDRTMAGLAGHHA
jgi:colanic acid/amylovoran biosynthesis protein